MLFVFCELGKIQAEVGSGGLTRLNQSTGCAGPRGESVPDSKLLLSLHGMAG